MRDRVVRTANLSVAAGVEGSGNYSAQHLSLLEESHPE